MKRLRHLRPRTKADDGILRVETAGGVVHIQTGLTDPSGRPMTVVRVLPFDGPGGTDRSGRTWKISSGLPEVILTREERPHVPAES